MQDAGRLKHCNRDAWRPGLRTGRGFSLIELMIVTVVLGIIVAIAVPSYRNFVARATRIEAKEPLLQIQVNQESFYLRNNTYTTDMSELGFPNAGCNPSDSGAYQICVTAADANAFTAVATYQGTDAEKDKCLTWQINDRGVKTSAPEGDCWTRKR